MPAAPIGMPGTARPSARGLTFRSLVDVGRRDWAFDDMALNFISC